MRELRLTINILPRDTYASAVLAVVMYPSVWLSVRLSVRPSHVRIVSKRLNVGSRKQRRTITPGL